MINWKLSNYICCASQEFKIQCCGSGMFIPDPDFYSSRIQKHLKMRGLTKKFVVITFLKPQISQNCKLFYFWNAEEKKFGPIFKELENCLPKKLSLSSQKYGFGIRIREKPILDPGSRGQKDTGSRIRIRNTENQCSKLSEQKAGNEKMSRRRAKKYS